MKNLNELMYSNLLSSKEDAADPFRDSTGIIYRICNMVDNKIYIGLAIGSFVQRYRAGKWWKWTHNPLLKQDYERLGSSAFMVDIFVCGEDAEMLREIEACLIRSHNSLHPHGYNMVSRSSVCKETSAETRKKMSLSGKARMQKYENPFQGKRHSEETKQYLRTINTGKVLSEATKQKIKLHAPRGANHCWFGKKMLPHVAEALKNCKRFTRRVVQIDPFSFIEINEFDSIKSAADITKICVTSISRSCRSNYLKAGGFIWKYKNEPLQS